MVRLAEWGEVAVNERTRPKKRPSSRSRWADIAITSWACQLDKEILTGTNLRFCGPRRGQRKGIVSDELYARVSALSAARASSATVCRKTALGLTPSAPAKTCLLSTRRFCNGGWVEDYSVITELFDITGRGRLWLAGSHYIELLQAFGVNVLALATRC